MAGEQDGDVETTAPKAPVTYSRPAITDDIGLEKPCKFVHSLLHLELNLCLCIGIHGVCAF